MNVLQAAKIRIRNVFANGCKIYLSFSSGKDSLCRTWSSPSCMTLQWLKLRSTRPTAGRSSRSVPKRYCDGGTLP